MRTSSAQDIRKVESDCLGVVQSAQDIAITITDNEKRIAAAFIRRMEHEMLFQHNFLFGNHQWRKIQSMHASLLRITMANEYSAQENARNLLGISCTCYDTKTNMRCVRKDGVWVMNTKNPSFL